MNSIERATSLQRVGRVIATLGMLGMAGVYVRALLFTPPDRMQGMAQKIFYLHAPAAMVALMAFFICGVASIVYLMLRDLRVDRFAAASAEVGLALSVVMLTTGPIWGKPVWGTWWTWDARLTSTLFIFLLFIGYRVLRNSMPDPALRGQYSAVIGIMGMVLVPFIHLTVYLFRTLHPDPVVVRPAGPDMPDVMLVTFASAVGAYLVLYVGFLIQSYAIAAFHDAREEALANRA